MQDFPQAVPTPPAAHVEPTRDPGQPAELMYQTVTIAAILLVLGSLWVF